MRSAKLDLKHSKKLFSFNGPKLLNKIYKITKDYALRIKLNFSSMCGLAGIQISAHINKMIKNIFLCFSYERE